MSDLVAEIQLLHQRIAKIEQDEQDLETMLEMTTAHSDTVEEELLLQAEKLKTQQEIDRRRTLSQMVAGVAHEINTPLGIANHAASIISELASDLAKALGQKASERETLDDILNACRLMQENIGRADRLVQMFKTLSVSQALDNLETVDLRKLTQDVVELYRLKARSSRLAIQVVDNLGRGDDAWEGYPGHYTQILLNLLTNIDRYAYPDGAGGKVEIELGALSRSGSNDRYAVVVRDFGCGIAPEHLDHVFEPFFTTGRGKGGTGLGLAIVKNLVTESLRGEIRITSRAGEGTKVFLSLPRITDPPADS
jgi:signal transduction histidine kinase